MSPLPQVPRLVSSELEAPGGALGPEPEDFLVDELPLHPPSGQGEHLYVRLRKRLWTTPDMVHAVARAAGVREREIGTAGMKDKHGVTSQWLSLPVSAAPVETWALPDGLEVLEAARSERKLRTGQQRGNHFRARLVGVTTDAAARAAGILELIESAGLPNYFGAQRFGHGGQNLARALDWLGRGAPSGGKQARFLRKLYPSVIQSEIFNRALTLRLEAGLLRVLEGDVVRLDGTGSVFVVDDPAREQPRADAGDILLTGPLPGSRMKAPRGQPAELERAAAAALGLGDEALAQLGALADGTRRDLLVRPRELSVDPLGEDALGVDFSLPSGSYATQLLRELTRAPWLEPRRASGD